MELDIRKTEYITGNTILFLSSRSKQINGDATGSIGQAVEWGNGQVYVGDGKSKSSMWEISSLGRPLHCQGDVELMDVYLSP